MTQTPTLTGQDIGEAEKATRAVLDQLLAEAGTEFHGWVILNSLGRSGTALDQHEVVSRIAHGLKTDEATVRAALAVLVGQELVNRVGSELTLTPAGTARFQRIREGIRQIAQRFYGDLPTEDLAAAHRVLATVTERANAELARPDTGGLAHSRIATGRAPHPSKDAAGAART